MYRHACIHSFSVCVCVFLCLSVHASACEHLLQCALWQDVSHRSHTDPDCSSHHNIRGYPLIWKPSNHGWAEQLAQTTKLTLMDLSRSKLGENGGKRNSWIPNFKKDVICFSWRYVGERSVTEALTAADRHGHTGNVCSLRLRRPVDSTPGIPENKTADDQAGVTACPRMMVDLGRVHRNSPLMKLLDVHSHI